MLKLQVWATYILSVVLGMSLLFQNCSKLVVDESSRSISSGPHVQLKQDLLSESINFWITFPGKDINELKRVLDPSNIHLWQSTFERTKVFKFYLVNIAPGHPTYMGDEGVALLKRFIIYSRAHGKKIAFEVGALYQQACDPESEGGGPFDENGLPKPSLRGINFEGGTLQSFIDSSVVVDYLVIDGPMIRIYDSLTSNCVKNFGTRISLEYAAREIAEYAAALKSQIPNVKFYLLVNFPNWNFKGSLSINTVGNRLLGSNNLPISFESALAATVSVGRSLGVTYEGLQIDNPHNFMIYGNGQVETGLVSAAVQQARWRRLKNLVDYSKELNLPTSLILNTETHEGANPTPAQLAQASQDFAYYTTAYAENSVANSLVFPELIVQSWYAVPSAILPESQNHSFTNTFKKVFEVFEGFNSNLTPVCRYTYSSWEPCRSNGFQSRILVSALPAGCTGTPVLSLACNYIPPVCLYSYSAWKDCQINNMQYREVVAAVPTGCVGTEVKERTCNYTAPTCAYTYSSWEPCQSNGFQRRNVVSALPAGCSGTPVLSAACDYTAPTIAQHSVHRLWNSVNGDFLTTLSSTEGNPYWQYVGEAFKLFSSNPNNNLVPLYRCVNTSSGAHYASNLSNCDGNGTQEGSLGFMSATVVTGSIGTAIHFCRNPLTAPILITINLAECTGMSERKILGYTK